MDHALVGNLLTVVSQQPPWGDVALVHRVRHELAAAPPLVAARSVRALRMMLTAVAAGEAYVLQAGDCAEDPVESTAGHVTRKAGLLDLLAGVLKMNAHKPVIRVGRIAGQYGKPRTNPVELVGGREIPVYRGHLVNSPDPDPVARKPDPWRMLSCYYAADDVLRHLGWRGPARFSRMGPAVWTSHEALVLDFETPMLRRDRTGRWFLASTHWPWIGERTRQLDGAHVALLADVVNPVSCKVGPRMGVDELLGLCQRINPQREPGRLTLISRMGAGVVPELLPRLVTAVREAGYPAIWLCDPMHGNTVTTPDRLKTRYVAALVSEVREFLDAVRAGGGVAGGLHLEVTPDDVTECVDDESGVERVGDHYTTLCDPRLNPRQAIAVVSAWTG